MTAHLTHTHEDGTLLDFDLRDHDELRDALKSVGFRYSRNIGWYRSGSRDGDLTHGMLARITEAFTEHGIELVSDVDNTPRPAAERIEAQRQRSWDRADALAAKAEKQEAKGDELWQRSKQMGDMIPMGQPVLGGHHSEKRHRGHLAKMRNVSDRAMQATNEANETKHRADAAAKNAAQHDDPGFVQRRIADAKDDDTRAYWQGKLDALVTDGAKVWGPDDFAVGDRVNGQGEIVRVNKKSITVIYDAFAHAKITNTMKYDKVKSHQPKEDA